MLSNFSNNKYDAELSSSAKKIVYSKIYNLKYISKASVFKDKLFISNYETKDITELNDVSFLFANNLRIESYPGIIGLKLVENDIRNVKSFPDQLNELQYINNSTWMIKYINDEEGVFNIGDMFNKELSPGFSLEKYRKTNAVVYGTYLSWDLTFSQIKSGSFILNGPMQSFLDFNPKIKFN